MSDVLNRDTLQYRRSVNTPDFPDPPWLEVPRGSANETLLRTVPTRYLVLTGDTLSEMDAQAKAAVDAAAREQARDAEVAQLDDVEALVRAHMQQVNARLNTRAATINGILTAISEASNLAAMKAAVALLAPVPEFTHAQQRNNIRNRMGS